MPLVFPTFNGLSYNVVRRPLAGSTDVQVHSSGREVRIGHWVQPLYEWDLTFNVLHDFKQWPSSVVQSELKRLQGFFLAVRASLIGFWFQDPDDNVVVGQPIATTNGSAGPFTLIRTYGDPSYGVTVTEPVGGALSTLGPFNVYLNGGLQSFPANYSFDPTPGANAITFTSAPPSGSLVTVDMTYAFFVHFKDNTLDFEKFAGAPGAGYWTVKKLTLASLRG